MRGTKVLVCTHHSMKRNLLLASTILVWFVCFQIETKAQELENVYRPYAFAYQSNDGLGTTQHRKESGNERGSVKGSYGFMDPFGTYRAVDYIADNLGFRAVVKTNERGTANQNPADTVWLVQQPLPESVQSDNRRLLRKISTPLQAVTANFTPEASPSGLRNLLYPSLIRPSSPLALQNQYYAPEYSPPVPVAPYFNYNSRLRNFSNRDSRFFSRTDADYYK